MIGAILAAVSKLAGGGVQPEGNTQSGSNSSLAMSALNAMTKNSSDNSGKSNIQSSDVGVSNSLTKPIPQPDMHFYGHMTVSKARAGREVNIVGNEGKGFINGAKTTEDKAFNHSSNIVGHVRGKKAR